MTQLLGKIRQAKRQSLKRQIAVTAGIIVLGLAVGVLQKWIDGSPGEVLPLWLQRLDIRNYFGRLAIWILAATALSVYSESPLRASINTFSFFISMLAGYYSYCHFVLGFLPKAYAAVWVILSAASFFMAYAVWYAKGQGGAAVILSGVILGVLFAQAFSVTQSFYVYHGLEVVTWLAGVAVLFRKPKELAAEIGLSLMVAVIYQLFIPHFG